LEILLVCVYVGECVSVFCFLLVVRAGFCGIWFVFFFGLFLLGGGVGFGRGLGFLCVSRAGFC